MYSYSTVEMSSAYNFGRVSNRREAQQSVVERPTAARQAVSPVRREGEGCQLSRFGPGVGSLSPQPILRCEVIAWRVSL